MKPTDIVDQASLRTDIPDFAPGDLLKVHVRVVEGSRERVQVFQGHVIARQGSGLQETFKVRKLSFQVGVERTFPVHSPIIAKIEVVTRGDVRRAKLYYLRGRTGKAAKIKEKSATAEYVAPPRVGSVTTEDLENFEADRELQLAQEYQDVAGMFRYAVETERRFYLANDVQVNVVGDGTRPMVEVELHDAWVWDMYRRSRFVPHVRVVTFKDVNVEELPRPEV